jgi:hypothetical protein
MARPEVADGGKASNMEGKGSKLKVNFTLEEATKAQNGSRGIALLFL